MLKLVLTKEIPLSDFVLTAIQILKTHLSAKFSEALIYGVCIVSSYGRSATHMF